MAGARCVTVLPPTLLLSARNNSKSMASNRPPALDASRGSLCLAVVALLLSSAQAFPSAPTFFPNLRTQKRDAFSSRGCASLSGGRADRQRTSLHRAGSPSCCLNLGLKLDLFDKDCVLYVLPPMLRDATGERNRDPSRTPTPAGVHVENAVFVELVELQTEV